MKLFKNKKYLMRFVALFFSVILWMYVISSTKISYEKPVRINLKLPKEYSLANDIPKEVMFFVEGPRAMIKSLAERDDKLLINMDDHLKRGQKKYSINLSALNYKLPFGVKVLKIEPRKIDINLATRHTKRIKVEAVFVGEIPAAHKMISSKLSPKTIEIAGSKQTLKNMKSVKTLPIELNGLTGKGEKTIKLDSSDDKIVLLKNKVKFNYRIKPTRYNMIIKNINIKYLSSKIIKKIKRKKVSLMVLADNVQQSSVKRSQIKIIGEVPDDASGEVQIKLKAILPENLHLLEIQPNAVDIVVE